MFSHSIAKAGISFPNLKNIITMEGKLNELVGKKQKIKEINERLKSTLAHNPNF
jgi:hypothetical protein